MAKVRQTDTQFDKALCGLIDAIDERLAHDPTGEAPAYAQAMTKWLARLASKPNSALVVAVRGQHFERWKSPRDAFPKTRDGYLRWRRSAMEEQARRLAELLFAKGLDQGFINRVVELVTKRRRASDPEVQVLEDCACLTFIERQWRGFADGRSADALERVVTRTLAKMSPSARALIDEACVDAEALEQLKRFAAST